MSNFSDISEHGIYPDLLRAFSSKGCFITVLKPVERKLNIKTNLEVKNNMHIINVRTGNLFNVSFLTKVISRAFLTFNYWRAIKRFAFQTKFDLLLYTTPPISLTPIIRKLKRKYNSYSYLMLKDIFPQNAVDLGMIRQNGVIFKLLRQRERRMYRFADKIGCMSEANVEFILNQEPWLSKEKVEICPNAIEIYNTLPINKNMNRETFELPLNKVLFIYGGSLGKPQGIDFLLSCIEEIEDDEVVFIVAGTGPYLKKISSFSEQYPNKIRVFSWLSIEKYESLIKACDVGLILLDHRFKIPNFPSRLLNYMEFSLPILAATDNATDIGRIAQGNEFGFWCESNNIKDFISHVDRLKNENLRNEMGRNARDYLINNYSVDAVVENIIRTAKVE